MAKFSGRIRVLLILTFLSKLTFAVQDALNDPSLEIIRQEDAEEGMDPGYSEQNTEKVETEIPPKSNVEVDTTEVNTLSEQEITDTVSVPDEKSGDEETNPDSKTETKAYDNKEREVYEGRNDLDIKSGSLVETNNEIYETGENIYKENNIPEKSVVEHNEQKDSSQSKKYETVEEGSKEESSSENGEILETESEEENLDNNDRENELNGKSKYLKSLEQQVRPIEQSLIADEEEQTLNERETENEIRAEKESGDSHESFQTLNHDTTYDTEETEIENVHENEEIPEDDKSMKEDITSLEDDEPANIAKEDVREESPLDMKSDGEIYESVLVNNESSEKESSIPDDEEKVEYNEVNENEQEVDNELDEEEWESQEVKNYQEIVEHGENMRPEVVMLGETMPLNEHKVNVEELHEAEQEEGKENFVERINDDENSHRTEEKDENKEEEAEEEEEEEDSQTQEISRDEEELEENHEIEHEELQKEEEEDENIKTLENPEKEEEHGKYKEEEDEEGTEVEDEPENDSRTEEKHVDEENELGNLENEEEEEIEEETTEDEQEEVEPPPAFYEAQNSPFHKMDEEVQPDEEEIDRCLQKPDSGFGKHAHWRLFFNSSTKECQNFLYGGIGGNANNFETLEDCLKACSTRHS